MAVAEFDWKDLSELTGLDKEKIIEKLTELGAPTEEKEDGKIVVEVTPNRPDLFFIEGVARLLNSYLKGKLYEYKTEKTKFALISDRSVNSVRPFVSAVLVRGVKVDEKTLKYLIDAQEKIHETVGRKRRKVAIGIHDAKTIEFPLIYRAVDDARFVPLDSNAEMGIKEILATHPKGSEYAHLVPGKAPIIMDKTGVISFPPIINSERTRMSENTQDVLVEVTGTHLETVNGVLKMFACALADREGKLFEIKVNGETCPDMKPVKMDINLNGFQKIIGIQLKSGETKHLLKKMGYGVVGNSALVAPYRMDIMDEVDIWEDIAIAYGYENIEPTMPNFFTSGNVLRKNQDVEEIMRSMGFMEIKTFTLTNKAKIAACGITGGYDEVLNAASEEYSIVKPSLIPSTLEVLGVNKTKGLPQKIYEIGTRCVNGKVGDALIFALVDKGASFSEIRSYLQTIMGEQSKEFEIRKNTENDCFESAKSGIIYSNGERIGKMGELKVAVKELFGLEFNVCVCELAL
ncbi:MAG: phenylalanine--tRNA ligase subunit beta [Candidatus Micrarchaeia archaeon]